MKWNKNVLKDNKIIVLLVAKSTNTYFYLEV